MIAIPALAALPRSIAWLCGLLGVISGAILLLFDLVALAPPASLRRLAALAPRAATLAAHAPISALPLLLVGAGYLALQLPLRPRGFELLKRLMLAAAFLLWGVVQLLRPGALATDLGDIVIVLYVLDLAIIIWAELGKEAIRADPQ